MSFSLCKSTKGSIAFRIGVGRGGGAKTQFLNLKSHSSNLDSLFILFSYCLHLLASIANIGQKTLQLPPTNTLQNALILVARFHHSNKIHIINTNARALWILAKKVTSCSIPHTHNGILGGGWSIPLLKIVRAGISKVQTTSNLKNSFIIKPQGIPT